MEPWQKDRIDLNHGWLMNEVCEGLRGGVLSIFRGNYLPTDVAGYVADRGLGAWARRSGEVGRLLECLPLEMSPGCLFDRLPLSRCDDATQSWLRPLVSALWRQRRNLATRTEGVKRRFDEANRLFLALEPLVKNLPDSCTVEDVRHLEPMFERFFKACYDLSKAIHELPNSIEVI